MCIVDLLSILGFNVEVAMVTKCSKQKTNSADNVHVLMLFVKGAKLLVMGSIITVLDVYLENAWEAHSCLSTDLLKFAYFERRYGQQ